MAKLNYKNMTSDRQKRASVIAKAGGLQEAISSGALPKHFDATVSEAIVLGLIRQDVSTFIVILGHGSTEVGEVLRIYEAAGLVRVVNVRNEVAAAHAATALRWSTGKKAAVITSIGPGALHAYAGSLVSASDGIGVWHLYGDETTEDEGPNMQQMPGHQQDSFLNICQIMGNAYCLHTPGSITTALRRGMNTVDNPHFAGPFFLLMPMNTQCSIIKNFNVEELPVSVPPRLGAASDNGAYSKAVDILLSSKKVVVKAGGGSRPASKELAQFIELADAAVVTSPLVSGVIPYKNKRNMTVGGSKGSLSGNYAMEEADCLVAIGTRFVCQSDCSRTGYPNVKHVININTDLTTAMHYGKNTSLLGDVVTTLEKLNGVLKDKGGKLAGSDWYKDCLKKREEWEEFKQARYNKPCLFDEVWQREVLTQPVAIKAVVDWARANDTVTFFDAGDVQANGFQIVEDDKLGRTFTDTGSSYMGFACSAVLSTALADKPFYGIAMTGDGSFMMNPQILIDGVEHGATGCILLFDNRCMAAISGLQTAQFGVDYATNDSVEVDYVAMARSVKGIEAFHGGYTTESLVETLKKAHGHKGLSLIHVPVYNGPDELGGMGVFGRWNVGNWCEDVQALRHKIGL